jgi:hypothetical protein
MALLRCWMDSSTISSHALIGSSSVQVCAVHAACGRPPMPLHHSHIQSNAIPFLIGAQLSESTATGRTLSLNLLVFGEAISRTVTTLTEQATTAAVCSRTTPKLAPVYPFRARHSVNPHDTSCAQFADVGIQTQTQTSVRELTQGKTLEADASVRPGLPTSTIVVMRTTLGLTAAAENRAIGFAVDFAAQPPQARGL